MPAFSPGPSDKQHSYAEWFQSYWQQGVTAYKAYMEGSFQKNNPDFQYKDFGPLFKPSSYDPKAWAKLFRAAGARYLVITSKHHDGFTLWPSSFTSGWQNARDTGPKRDLLGPLADAVRAEGLAFGVYYSLYEWYHREYLADKQSGFATRRYVLEKALPELRELFSLYQPSILWSDGHWEAPDTYWGCRELLLWLYNESPSRNNVVTNDRCDRLEEPRHGDFYNYNDNFESGVYTVLYSIPSPLLMQPFSNVLYSAEYAKCAYLQRN